MGKASNRKWKRREEALASRTSLDFAKQEKEAGHRTLQEFKDALDWSLVAINLVVDAFNSEARFTVREEKDQAYLLLLLLSRGLSTARNALRLIIESYYTQAFMLIRHLNEDWVIGMNIPRNEWVREALWANEWPHGRQPHAQELTFQALATSLSQDIGDWWRTTYGEQSEIAHARGLSLAIQAAGDEIRTGPVFDRNLAKIGFLDLVMASFRLATLSGTVFDSLKRRPRDRVWLAKAFEEVRRANKWAEKTYGAELQALGGDEVPTLVQVDPGPA